MTNRLFLILCTLMGVLAMTLPVSALLPEEEPQDTGWILTDDELDLEAVPDEEPDSSLLERMELQAEAALLMDAETGQVLYDKSGYARMYPASITKIMTGLLALEGLDAGETLTASATAVDTPAWGSSAYIQEGEELTVDQVLYAMMLRSANEAANVLAEAVAGDLESFAQMMNDRARALGAVGTHFQNAHGLPERDHYTTAYDMALITREAIGTPGFLDYMGRDTYTVPATNKWEHRIFTNTHKMLLSDSRFYSTEVLGGKTGYTGQAGYTLVTASRRGGRTLISVVLDSDSYYADTQALLEYGFTEFAPYTYRFVPHETDEASIWDGGREAGRAYFSPPDSATVLLHKSVAPADIVEEYRIPHALELEPDEDLLHAAVVLRVTQPGDGGDSGLPNEIIAVPLEVSVTTFELQPGPAEAAGGEVWPFPALSLPPEVPLLIVAGAFAVLSGSICIIAAVRAENRRRAARIMRRGRRCRTRSHREYNIRIYD